ncbi:hypothetical protein R3P38DRAFT_2472649, partial [Favolaschia claudopus]
DKTPPAARILKLYKDRSRAEASIITQLRTGHIGLHAPLYCINIVNCPMCLKCGVPKTVSHYLLVCRRYVAER